MSGKSITVLNGDGSTRTITIPDRSRYAGRRTISKNDGSTLTIDRPAAVITSDRAGESRPLLSKVVGGAAAAYSLRDLNDRAGRNKVVRVRRSSDNHEKDFTAADLRSGRLTNWANAQMVRPLDLRALSADGRAGDLIDTPKAAHSLRSLGKRQAADIVPTGDTGTPAAGAYVVQVRRSGDNNVKSFTADELADGVLEGFCGQQDITSSLNLLSEGGEVSSVTDKSNFTLSYSEASSNVFTSLRNRNTLGSGTYKLTGTIVASNLSADVLFRSAGGNNSFQSSPFTNGTNVINETFTLKGGGANNLNIFAQANATGSLVFSNLKLERINCDGHVRTWYDQSTGGNHATQLIKESQPKIVEAGTYLEKLDFNGASHFLYTDFGSDLAQPNSFFILHQFDSNSSVDNVLFDTPTVVGARTVLDNRAGRYRMFAGTSASGDVTIDTNGHLLTAIYNGASSKIALDGTLGTVGDVGTSGISQYSYIGRSFRNHMKGSIREIIIYNSDQSDNRTALEANIGEHYGISGIPAYDGFVDGFVETWYDQSGNSNDARQAVIRNQPKIVGEVGAGEPHKFLGEIEFDGVGTYLGAPHVLSQDDLLAVHAVANFKSTARQRLVGNSFYNAVADNGGFVIEPHSFSISSIAGLLANASTRTYLLGNPSDIDTAHYQLFTLELAGGTVALYTDGTEVESKSGAMNSEDGGNGLTIGASPGGRVPFDGTAREIIIYNSDQSDNRAAIEANINNQYSIY